MSEMIRDTPVFKKHVARLKASLKAHSPDTICEFIQSHTFLNGEPFSFAGHEYQRTILQDPSPNIVILKSAQIGISEMSARLAVARAALINGFSTIYTLPSAMAAQAFMKSRINPIIDGSPYIKDLVSNDVDNTSVKRLGNSYLWLKGCQVDRQAISTPADMLIFDEVDNSDQDVMTLFESRIIHSPYKMTVKLSTPTIPGYGITKAFEQSKRKFNFAQCGSCGEWFYPEYFQHVRIPGYKKELQEVAKSDFADPKFRWTEARLECPKCGSPVNQHEVKREWVVENPLDAYFDSGYRVSPFESHAVSCSDLVKASVTFNRPQDFVNQRLGVAMADSETALGEQELDAALISEYPGGGYSYVIGLDMGNFCWLTVAAVLPDNSLIIVKVEKIPLHEVVARASEVQRQYRARMLTVDHGPATETVYRIQQVIRNSFAAVFVQSKNIELYKVVEKGDDAAKGVESMRQVNISKDQCMDLIMMMIRTGQIKKVSDESDKLWKAHMMDNKRIRAFKGGELVLTWVKTEGEDHYHMSLLYAMIASRILGVSAGCISRLPLLSSFRVTPE